MGYGIPDIDSPTTLCNFVSDRYIREKETVFQIKMGTIDAHDVDAKEWGMYADVTSEKAGFICEKEGSIINIIVYLSLRILRKINFAYTS